MTENRGFTFIEVLVAMAIFVMAVVVSVGLTGGAVKATKESKEITTATWLLGNVMVQLETRLETEGFDKGCEKKKDAKFEAPYERFTWTTYCQEIDFNLSQTAAKMMKDTQPDDGKDASQEDMIQKMVLETASTYISKSIRELHAEVTWMAGKQKRTIDATTHIARYDQPLTVSPIATPH